MTLRIVRQVDPFHFVYLLLPTHFFTRTHFSSLLLQYIAGLSSHRTLPHIKTEADDWYCLLAAGWRPTSIRIRYNTVGYGDSYVSLRWLIIRTRRLLVWVTTFVVGDVMVSNFSDSYLYIREVDSNTTCGLNKHSNNHPTVLSMDYHYVWLEWEKVQADTMCTPIRINIRLTFASEYFGFMCRTS